jgi:cytoskeletal protein RodZ
MTSQEQKKPFSATEARQGVRGMRVFTVLVTALVLAAIVWAGVEIWGRHIEPNKPQPDAPAVSSSTGTQPQGGAIDNSPPAGQSAQPAPTDRTENNQQGITSTPAQPSRDGTQN